MADAKKLPKDKEKDLDRELEEFSKTTRKVTTIEGKIHEYPRVGWVVEAQILRTLGKLLKRVPAIFFKAATTEEGEAQSQDLLDLMKGLTGQDILEIISMICEEVPDEITIMVSMITRQDEDWVNEFLDLEGIAEVLLPFFYERKLKISKLISQWKGKINPNALAS